MFRLVAATLTAAAAMLAAPNALACDCSKDQAQETESDAIFFGQVERVSRGGTDRATVAVEYISKGAVSRRTVVSTPGSAAECGVPFARGKDFYIFARKDGDDWHTTRCMGTRKRVENKLDDPALERADLTPKQRRALKRVKSMGDDFTPKPPPGAAERFDVSPPDAGFDDEDDARYPKHLADVMRRQNRLRPYSEARELADKYLPIIYEDAPPPTKYSDDAYRVLEAFYEAGDCQSVYEHAEKLEQYIGPFEIQVDRWRLHCKLIDGDFDAASEIADGLDARVGYDERTDGLLEELAEFAVDSDGGMSGDFAEYLRRSRDVDFVSEEQRLAVVRTLVDLHGDTELLRAPVALIATAQVLDSLDASSKSTRHTQGIAYFRAANLAEDTDRKSELMKRARVATQGKDFTLDALEYLVFDSLPPQRFVRDDVDDNQQADAEAREATNKPEKPEPRPVRVEPEPDIPEETFTANEDGLVKNWTMLAALGLGLIALLLVAIALGGSSSDDD
jgi:hypothetical protein